MSTHYSSSQPDMMECFICAGSDAPLHLVCKCNTLVHPECFLKLLSVPSHNTHCAVCKQGYDLKLTLGWRCHHNKQMLSVVVIVFTSLGVITCAFVLTYGSGTLPIIVYFSTVWCIVLSFFKLCMLHRRHNVSGCCWIQREIVEKLVILGEPVVNAHQVTEESLQV
jgi:hypothetical protein